MEANTQQRISKEVFKERDMTWLPIESYDKLKKKPKLAVFWFEAVETRPGAYRLEACANLSRVMGSRVCTHWMPLPDGPERQPSEKDSK